jgi:hypothetical protein
MSRWSPSLGETMKFLLLALLAADPQAVEVFKDKGDLFVRAGTNRGLKVGTELVILGDRIGDSDEHRAGGTAIVLEVWATLARISPDEEARKLKDIKLARISGAAAPAPAPVAKAAPPPKAEPAPAGNALKGRASFIGIGPAKRITISNDGSTLWTKCDLRLPNNKHYVLDVLRPGDHESIVYPRFKQDGTELDRPLDWILVKCEEGQSRFSFSM